MAKKRILKYLVSRARFVRNVAPCEELEKLQQNNEECGEKLALWDNNLQSTLVIIANYTSSFWGRWVQICPKGFDSVNYQGSTDIVG